MHTAYDEIVPFNMKYLFVSNFLHDLGKNCIPIAGSIKLPRIVSADAFSHHEYFIYIFSIRLFILRIFQGSKSMNYQSIFSHSHYDSHAATVSQHENIHNERDSIRKAACNRKKLPAEHSKKKFVFNVRIKMRKTPKIVFKTQIIMQPFMP
jgi:hypothetical protein